MFEAQSLIDYGGLFLIFLAIYSQTGLFFCFFIPSGAFMFTSGAMIASGDLHYNLITVSCLLVFAAITGNITGYLFGRKAGALLKNRKDSWFFKQKHIATAERFYDKYGGRALSVGLFVPIVRTFAPIVAGMVRLKIPHFILYITLGSVCWVLSFLLTGYLVGSRPFLKPYLNYIIVGVILLISAPFIVKIIRRATSKKTAQGK